MSAYSEQAFEQKLYQLKDTHDSIANLSNWCLQNQEHYKEIVGTWLNVLKRVRMEQRLLMFYLANDVIQYSKRKQLPFVDAFAPALQKATTMVRDNSIRNKILRLFKIWEDRKVYDESFLVDLSGLLTHGNKANPRIDVEDYQPQILYSRLRSCKSLEKESKQKKENIDKCSVSLKDVEQVSTTLKDRKVSEEVVSEIDEVIGKVSEFIKALEAEVKERKGLVDLLDTAEQYYEREYKEAKIVVNAYKCFTNRVKVLKKKAEEKIDLLESNLNQTQPVVKPAYDDAYASHESFMTSGDPNDPAFLNCYRPEPVVRNNLEIQGRANGPEVSKVHKNLPEPFGFPFNQPPPPTLETKSWDSSYSSLDQRLAMHKFNLGRLEMKSPPDPSIDSMDGEMPESILVPFQESNYADEEMNNPNCDVSQVEQIPTLDANARVDSLAHNWEVDKDFESPLSPPTFEKTGFSRPNADVDMRVKDIDHRNLISLTDPLPTDWSSSSEYTKARELSNVEDMELSDDEEKKLGKSIDDVCKNSQGPYDVNRSFNDSLITENQLLLPPPPPPPAVPIHQGVQLPPPPPPPLPPLLTPLLKQWSSPDPNYHSPTGSNFGSILPPPPPPPLPATGNSMARYSPMNYNSPMSGPPVRPNPHDSYSQYSPRLGPPTPTYNQPNFNYKFSPGRQSPVGAQRRIPVYDYNHQSIRSPGKREERFQGDKGPRFNTPPRSHFTPNSNQRVSVVRVIPTVGDDSEVEHSVDSTPSTPRNSNIKVVNTNQNTFDIQMKSPNFVNTSPNVRNHLLPTPRHSPHQVRRKNFNSGYQNWT